MKAFRALFGGIVGLLLVLGYALSQIAYFGGWAPLYAERVDSPTIKFLALVALIITVLFACLPQKEQSGEAAPE